MAGERTKSELDLLQTVDDTQIISQAALSERLGIATGLVNFLMKRAISKGFMIAKRMPARRFAYFLTPKGLVEKTRLVADYINTSLKMYRHFRNDYNNVCGALVNEGRCRIIVVGDVELAELAILAAFEAEVEVVNVVCDKTNRDKIATVPVVSHIALLDDIDDDVVFVNADIYHAQAVHDGLVSRFGADVVISPESLYVKCGVTDDEAAAMPTARHKTGEAS